MNLTRTLPKELEFLNETHDSLATLIKRLGITPSQFNGKEWKIAGLQSKINFDIRLLDGSNLIDQKNRNLLLGIKHWIVTQARQDILGGFEFSRDHVLKRIRITLSIIDYIFLNDHSIGIHRYGFEALTERVIDQIIFKIIEKNTTSERFYDWPSRLEKYLREIQFIAPPIDCENHLQEAPNNHEPQAQKNFKTSLSPLEASNARFHIKQKSTNRNATLFFRVAAQIIYSNTLYGNRSFPIPPELSFPHRPNYHREFKQAPTRDTHSVIVKQNYRLYLACLGSLSEIQCYGHIIPQSALCNALKNGAEKLADLTDPGRYSTVPIPVAMNLIKDSVEFFLNHSGALLNACLSLYKASRNINITPQNYSDTYGIDAILCPHLKQLGVKELSIKKSKTENTISYHESLRENYGLIELIKVLYGSAEIIIGSLSARRQDELLKLLPKKSLDKNNKLLIFENGKSGFADTREIISRPIPGLCVKIITTLERFQDDLMLHGFIENHAALFSIPSQKNQNLKAIGAMTYNDSLDICCDYFQTPANDQGERYYIRQHQLRRFFAQLFFWSSSFGGFDTLTWFLGHTDAEHLYHYITESTPGSMLRSVKIDYAAEILREGISTHSELESMVAEKFKTTKFSILDESELKDYIDSLIEESALSIEPEFFEAQDGKRYKIILKVMHVKR